jgi:hypothetical protein
LDKKYSKLQRAKVTKLDLSNKNLEGSLDLSSFKNLEELNCSNNRLESLKLNTSPLSVERLKTLILTDNCFNTLNLKDLTFFTPFTNLKKLEIGNYEKTRIFRNCFNGSLEKLENLNKLELLDISNTDISEGLEYLPDNLSTENVKCSVDERPESRVKVVGGKIKGFKNIEE